MLWRTQRFDAYDFDATLNIFSPSYGRECAPSSVDDALEHIGLILHDHDCCTLVKPKRYRANDGKSKALASTSADDRAFWR
ncbi:MAG TPA: hypothetical protein DEP07_27495 [Brevibacillus sp.]|nr:hypothetical protein EDM60_05390 [Brevibacillus parabrevis]HBZ84086.1 hypothetical protein [Brevibacillus sp.]